MTVDRTGRSKQIRKLVERVLAARDGSPDRDIALAELQKKASAVTDELNRVLIALFQANSNQFEEVLTQFIERLSFGYPPVDFIPFRRAIDDEPGPFWDHADLEQEFDEEKQRIGQMIAQGSAVDAFVALAEMLCALHGQFQYRDSLLVKHSKQFNKELATERINEGPKVLGPLNSAVGSINKLVSARYLSPTEADQMFSLLEQARERYWYPYERVHPDPNPKSHRITLGAELIRLFDAVGFNRRRGDLTKDRAAHFAVAIASRFLFGLNSDTLRNVRVSSDPPS